MTKCLVAKVEAGKEAGGWRVLGGWSKGRPWACGIQTLLKQETD